MPIKLIVTDLDRTLLRTDKTISAYSAGVLARCRQYGIKVAFATARPWRAVTQYVLDVPVDAVIVHNGAAIYLDGEPVFHRGIPPETARDILLSIARDFPEATLSVEIDDINYANFDASTAWKGVEYILSDFTDLPAKPAEKIIAGVSSMADIALYEKYLPDELYIEMSEGTLGLIMHRGATKILAVKELAKHFGIETGEAAAFGDDTNDLEMLRDCGIGVAMTGALDEVKAVADHICWTNDGDGVAGWIEENVLNNTSR